MIVTAENTPEPLIQAKCRRSRILDLLIIHHCTSRTFYTSEDSDMPNWSSFDVPPVPPFQKAIPLSIHHSGCEWPLWFACWRDI